MSDPRYIGSGDSGREPANLRRLLTSQLAAIVAAAALLAGVTAPPVVAAQPLLQNVPQVGNLSYPPTTSQCLALYGIHCYQPAQFEKAYDLTPLFSRGIDGRGETIAIVDAFGSPTIVNDLHVFDTTFGLPDPPSLKIIAPAGPVPAFDPTNDDMVGWAEETTLDVEWSHVFAPGANILLVETPVSETEGVTGFPEIVKAENYVINHNMADVISQSFGATENTFPSAASLLNLRSAFVNAYLHNVTVLGASGDTGATDYELNLSDLYPYRVDSWPSTDPLVTSVGGTQLTLDDAGNRLAPDMVWNDGYGAGGGGVSSIFSRPGFQDGVRNVVGGRRGTPDVSLSAAVDGAVVFYYTFLPGHEGYHLVGGTSESTPEFAGIVAMADQVAHHRLGLINGQLYNLLRGRPSGVVDITIGNNTFGPFTNSDGNTYTVVGYKARPGYDLASGVGTIDAARFVPALAGH